MINHKRTNLYNYLWCVHKNSVNFAVLAEVGRDGVLVRPPGEVAYVYAPGRLLLLSVVPHLKAEMLFPFHVIPHHNLWNAQCKLLKLMFLTRSMLRLLSP